MDRELPIGLLDSGVGGLTVAKEIMRQMPKERIIYIGDNARCPYGPRPREEIQDFTWDLVKFLLNQKIKMLIIACNTATAAALVDIKAKLDIPVLGVINPGARAAIKATKNKSIGVIGTIATIESGAYELALKSIHPYVKVTSLACPKFVPIVESCEWNSRTANKIIDETLTPFKQSDIDTLVLGCTHYPLIYNSIHEVMGPNVKIISSGEETAREASVVLHHNNLMMDQFSTINHQFFTTGSRSRFKQIAQDWLEIPIATVGKARL